MTDERHEAFEFAVFSAAFAASYFFLGPLVHEAFHIGFLKYTGCFYSVEWAYHGLRGVSAAVQPYCYLDQAELLFFYLSGYLAVLLAGGALAFWSLEFQDLDTVKGVFTGSLGAGMLMALGVTIAAEGDISNALQVLGISTRHAGLVRIFVLLGASSTSLKLLQHIFDRSEWENRRDG
ncbi:MAG: hypothetical protein ABEJ69_03220 [Candidatus Nanohaloarchaea archaeon]